MSNVRANVMTSSACAPSSIASTTTAPVTLRSNAGLNPVVAQARQITDELRTGLNQHGLSRKVFLQLAVLEHEFKRLGYRCLESLPLKLLETALEQLVFVMGRAPGEWRTPHEIDRDHPGVRGVRTVSPWNATC